MKRRRYISKLLSCLLPVLALMLICIEKTHAQQDPVYSQYINNPLSVNPAYAGVREVGSASATFRKQWLNLEGSPLTSSFNLSMPFDSLNVAAGLDFMYDNIGPVTTTAFFLDYSYKIKASGASWLRFGLKGGFNYLQSSLTRLDRYHYDDQYLIDYGDYRRFMPNFGVGLFWWGENFYAGISLPRLIENKYHRDETSLKTSSREERHYFIQGAYIYRLSNPVVFKPAINIIATAGAPVSANFNFNFIFYDRFGVGAMYRISDAVGAYAQFRIDQLKIGFSYDYSHTRLSQYNNGTFEILLRYDFKTSENQALPSVGF